MSIRSVLPFPSNPTNFNTNSIPDQTGKVVLVTGGNTGIGFETCLELARKGATVYLAARSEERATDAITRIKAQIPEAKITFLKLDLQDLKQIVSSANEFKQKESKLDILINNAGIMASPFCLTKYGIEEQFATNHVGHYLLTRELLPCILKASPSRIVNLSSYAHTGHPPGGIQFENINDESKMSNAVRYGQSKLANLLFSAGLHKRFGDKVFVNSVHPGFVNTELLRGVSQSSIILGKIGGFVSSLIGLSPPQGALTSLYCATSPDIVLNSLKNKYFVPLAQMEEPRLIARDEALADKLWDFTENLVNEKLSQ